MTEQEPKEKKKRISKLIETRNEFKIAWSVLPRINKVFYSKHLAYAMFLDGLRVGLTRNEIITLNVEELSKFNGHTIVQLQKRVAELEKYEKFAKHIYGHRPMDKGSVPMDEWVICKICNKSIKEINDDYDEKVKAAWRKGINPRRRPGEK